MATGPAEVEGTWYVFSSSGSLLFNGWVWKDGEWYYGASGAELVRGWKLISGLWYWLDPAKGGRNGDRPR